VGIPLAILLGDHAGVDRWLAERDGGDMAGPGRRCLGAALTALRPPPPVRRWLDPALTGLRTAALAADPNLERPFEKTRDQILHALEVFEQKATAAAARKNEGVDRRTHHLREACLPLDRPQERIVSTAHFPGKYGPQF